MEPTVSIVIATWNRKSDCLNCLRSLLDLSSPHPAIILVDNGSTDGTVPAVAKQFPRVEVISTGENLGFSGGNNVGIERALQKDSDYICLLNNDTIVSPAFLDELLKAAAAFPRAGILGARVYFSDRPNIVWSQGISINPFSGRIYSPFHNHPEKVVPSTPEEVSAVSAAAVLLRREVVEKVGKMDEDYFLYYEDVDYCLRGRQTGFRVLTVPASRVWHRVSTSMGGEGSTTVIYYATRNHLLALNRCLPLPLPARGLRNLLVIFYNFLFATVTSHAPLRLGLRAWQRGVSDYFRKQLGKLPVAPAVFNNGRIR